jgi:hypothetical protein
MILSRALTQRVLVMFLRLPCALAEGGSRGCGRNAEWMRGAGEDPLESPRAPRALAEGPVAFSLQAAGQWGGLGQPCSFEPDPSLPSSRTHTAYILCGGCASLWMSRWSHWSADNDPDSLINPGEFAEGTSLNTSSSKFVEYQLLEQVSKARPGWTGGSEARPAPLTDKTSPGPCPRRIAHVYATGKQSCSHCPESGRRRACLQCSPVRPVGVERVL